MAYIYIATFFGNFYSIIWLIIAFVCLLHNLLALVAFCCFLKFTCVVYVIVVVLFVCLSVCLSVCLFLGFCVFLFLHSFVYLMDILVSLLPGLFLDFLKTLPPSKRKATTNVGILF